MLGCRKHHHRLVSILLVRTVEPPMWFSMVPMLRAHRNFSAEVANGSSSSIRKSARSPRRKKPSFSVCSVNAWPCGPLPEPSRFPGAGFRISSTDSTATTPGGNSIRHPTRRNHPQKKSPGRNHDSLPEKIDIQARATAGNLSVCINKASDGRLEYL